MNSIVRQEILKLKEDRQAIILAHYYQRPEIQDIADFTGDSFALSQQAAATDAKVIVFCGVHFMAECAYILAPDKLVLLPEPEAGCPMADMANVQQLKDLKQQHPDAAVVSYVNTTAAVKAESDICCTSANALQVVQSIPNKKIIYTPDRNMGNWLKEQTDKEVILWEGYCYTHERLTPEDIEIARRENPQAVVVVHPECPPGVAAIADYVTGTSGMLRLVREHPAQTFIVGTESGLGHALKRAAPEKEFIFPSKHLVCASMKLNTLAKIHLSLKTLTPSVTVPEDIRIRARGALDRMLAIR